MSNRKFGGLGNGYGICPESTEGAMAWWPGIEAGHMARSLFPCIDLFRLVSHYPETYAKSPVVGAVPIPSFSNRAEG